MVLDGRQHLTFVNIIILIRETVFKSIMKRFTFVLLQLLFFSLLQAQPVVKAKKYPSLLWEITGKGLKKPSYLIGTMHVSSKLAFNLPDSFYHAIRSADVVALETNPETWQDDMNKYDLSGGKSFTEGNRYSIYTSMPSDYLTINTLKFFKYYNKIERSLYSNPSTINSLLYRTYGNESSDFEEDTYLDMYIFQCGKKLGKKVAGVEDYGESMKLMAEAYKDAAKDKNRKERSYGDAGNDYSGEKLEEAYRTGNLDLLDSINRYNSESAAFDEKFLYRRNEIQARSIDSIIASGAVLFVGVGAAHLPGDRGVIELLRKKGYHLRPVKMGARAGKEKELLDKVRVPVTFRSVTAKDGGFKVDIPGTFFKTGDDAALDQQQFADMANGSYYMVTRIMTNAWLWDHSTDEVFQKVDSLLYENVPGKLLSKSTVYRNGYKGLDITSRTRRGDLQRYNIFITPFEILFFKMSGNGDYVRSGDEAKRFFGSIQLKEYRSTNGWTKYSPAFGGFTAELPHEPYLGNDGSWIFDAEDKSSGINYRIIRSDIHNYHFAEEDTFDLGLMDESFKSSEFIDTTLFRKQILFKGYPALDAKYRDRNGNIFLTRFVICGPHYYTLVAHGKQEALQMQKFLNSFELRPFNYGKAKLYADTALYYTVNTTYFPRDEKIKLDFRESNYFSALDDEEEENEEVETMSGTYRNKVIVNDTTGEKIFVSFSRLPQYYYTKDSSVLDTDNQFSARGGSDSDSSWIVKWKRKGEWQNKFRVWESVLTDSGSSRIIHTKYYYKDGVRFVLMNQSDSLTAPSSFVQQFFESFKPADTLQGINPFEKKSALFFKDFLSNDSARHKRAVKSIGDIYLDSADLPLLKKSISWINWDEKKYLNVKKELINKLGDIKTRESANYLKELYYALDDTVQLQYAVLENLLQHKNNFAYSIFRDIINDEPPVLDFSTTDYSAFETLRLLSLYRTGSFNYKNGRFLDELSDSLQLTKSILPDLLPLLNLDDYKSSIMKLLGQMVDSNVVQPWEYEAYFNKFMTEAKLALKKQAVAEKKKAIIKAEENKSAKKKPSYLSVSDEDDYGNEDLDLYATLLLPFWDTKISVQPLIQQMLRSNDKRLKYKTMLLMLDNKKQIPDTLLAYFAGLDDYRYELYSDMRKRNLSGRFPAAFIYPLALGRSKLLNLESYDKPDTIVYLDRLPAVYRDKSGYVYFFKYKTKKDDLSWKLATVGLVPADSSKFEFDDNPDFISASAYSSLLSGAQYTSNKYDFTKLRETRFKEDESVAKQITLELKRILYSRRKSAREFYRDENGENEYTD
ncbi:MAG TPA: TraB/GumN family protein [Chitinophagaceae bacterium]|nr:TraB/GumN family protein [Chitinophagaceae bacterium]